MPLNWHCIGGCRTGGERRQAGSTVAGTLVYQKLPGVATWARGTSARSARASALQIEGSDYARCVLRQHSLWRLWSRPRSSPALAQFPEIRCTIQDTERGSVVAQRLQQPGQRPISAAAVGEVADHRERANAWTIGLAAGLPEGTFLPFAAEIARNLNDGMEIARPADRHARRHRQRPDLLYLQRRRHRDHRTPTFRSLPHRREDPQHRAPHQLHHAVFTFRRSISSSAPRSRRSRTSQARRSASTSAGSGSTTSRARSCSRGSA